MRSSGARRAAATHVAAGELSLRRGYAASSLREIAARVGIQVGIQVGSLYDHIEGKQQRLSDVAHGVMDVVDAQLQDFSIVASGTHVARWYWPGERLSLDEDVAAYAEATMRRLEVEGAGSFAGLDAHATAGAGVGGGG